MLATLRRHRIRLAILSNGTPKLLMTACQATSITALVDAIISVEQPGSFKPEPAVYGLVLASRLLRHGDPDEYGLRPHLVAELQDLTGLSAVLVPPPA